VTRYIAFRLVRASMDKPNVDFSREALRLIFERSSGVPRLVNLICDNAMLVGYSRDVHLIDSQIVSAAITQMMPNFHNESTDTFAVDRPASAELEREQELEHGRRL
jgi:hypothetical protein